MDYKELLNRCKTKPGWLSSKEQQENEAHLNYMAWVKDLNREYIRKKRAEAKMSKRKDGC